MALNPVLLSSCKNCEYEKISKYLESHYLNNMSMISDLQELCEDN